MSAVLSDLGNRESRDDMLTMSVIVGTNSPLHSFKSQVGSGSSSHDFACESLMIFHISTSYLISFCSTFVHISTSK